MPSSGGYPELKGIKTEVGNDIIESLKKEGWKIISEYSAMMFDKDIVFDCYTLENGSRKLAFE